MNPSSVPNTWAQCQSAFAAGTARERLACVFCGQSIRTGSRCNACTDLELRVLERRHPGETNARLRLRLEEPFDCDCGRPMPRGAICCSSCAWRDGLTRRRDNGRIAEDYLYVSVLRELGACTSRELERFMARDQATVWRALARLVGRGRVREMRDSDEGSRSHVLYALSG